VNTPCKKAKDIKGNETGIGTNETKRSKGVGRQLEEQFERSTNELDWRIINKSLDVIL